MKVSLRARKNEKMKEKGSILNFSMPENLFGIPEEGGAGGGRKDPVSD